MAERKIAPEVINCVDQFYKHCYASNENVFTLEKAQRRILLNIQMMTDIGKRLSGKDFERCEWTLANYRMQLEQIHAKKYIVRTKEQIEWEAKRKQTKLT